jgi:hypothetical protein
MYWNILVSLRDRKTKKLSTSDYNECCILLDQLNTAAGSIMCKDDIEIFLNRIGYKKT